MPCQYFPTAVLNSCNDAARAYTLILLIPSAISPSLDETVAEKRNRLVGGAQLLFIVNSAA
jgi:hypothetical protein